MRGSCPCRWWLHRIRFFFRGRIVLTVASTEAGPYFVGPCHSRRGDYTAASQKPDRPTSLLCARKWSYTEVLLIITQHIQNTSCILESLLSPVFDSPPAAWVGGIWYDIYYKMCGKWYVYMYMHMCICILCAYMEYSEYGVVWCMRYDVVGEYDYVWCIMWHIWYMLYVSDTWHMMNDMCAMSDDTSYDIWTYIVYDTWYYVMPDGRCIMYGMCSGIWWCIRMVYGVWHMVHGIWYMTCYSSKHKWFI